MVNFIITILVIVSCIMIKLVFFYPVFNIRKKGDMLKLLDILRGHNDKVLSVNDTTFDNVKYIDNEVIFYMLGIIVRTECLECINTKSLQFFVEVKSCDFLLAKTLCNLGFNVLYNNEANCVIVGNKLFSYMYYYKRELPITTKNCYSKILLECRAFF